MRLSTLFIAGSAVFVSANEVAIPTGSEIVPEWTGSTAQDLHREYNNIFRHGNRNAASHKWTTFLLDRAHQMTDEKLQYMFGGFCAVSGSPVNPTEYNRYRLNLDLVGGGKHTGFMQYCCWPCVCDTQDFIKIDTKTITTKDGARQYHFTVLGNPCDHPEELSKPFVQPFDGRSTTILQDAPEVRCGEDGTLTGATLSDHGYTIINMFFEAPGAAGDPIDWTAAGVKQQPGRMREMGGLTFQDEGEYAQMCTDRAQAGYNSGMGEIFRKVAAITPVPVLPALAPPEGAGTDGGETGANCNTTGEPAAAAAVDPSDPAVEPLVGAGSAEQEQTRGEL